MIKNFFSLHKEKNKAESQKLLRDKETRKEIAKITKEFVKKFYRELSQNSTYVVDKIDV